MRYQILFALIVIKISLAPTVFANHQAGGVTLALGLGFPVGFDSTASNSADPDSDGGYKLILSPGFLPIGLAYSNFTAGYDETTTTSIKGTEEHSVYEILIRVPIGEFGMAIGLGVGTVSFSPDESKYSVDDADSVAYSLSFVTPPILGPILLLGGIGVIDASDSDIKNNGVVESTKYNGSATIPYLGAVVIF
jgi:hypothetical protein